MDLSTITIGGISGVFIVQLIVTLVKTTGKVKSEYLPIVSQFAGIIFGLLWAYETSNSYIIGCITGMAIGAVASGYYDVLTKVTNKYKTS